MAIASDPRNAGRAAYAAAATHTYRNVAKKYRIKNRKLRTSCRRDLAKFLDEYTPEPFYLPFSNAHRELVADVQRVTLDGGRIAVAMPRGSGKSTILSRALLWAALYGHRLFPVLAAAADTHFKRMLSALKMLLNSSDRLLADFPEVIDPIREVDNKAIRINGQHWNGTPTAMLWTTETIRFPSTPATKKEGNAGITISGGGLLGSLRGMNTTLPSGEVIRPDLLLFDDVQTRRSAESLAQCEERSEAIYDCLAMAGPGKDMAAFMACTVIAPDDVSDRYLSPERPDWISHRVKTLVSFPRNMDAWDAYNEVRRSELLGEFDKGASRKHYKKHRKKLDAGAEHYWPELIDEGKESAIQSAMDLYLEDARSFMSERQNDPQYARDENQLEDLSVLQLIKRTKPFKEGVIPGECTTVTAHIDVQSNILFWTVVAWTPEFGGHVVTYGTTPRRTQRYFTLDQLNKGNTLARAYPKTDEVGRIRAGIRDTIQHLNREWPREGGTTLTLARILVDGGYQLEAVERAVRDSGCAVATVARGVGIGAVKQPMITWAKQPGQVNGLHWVLRAIRQGRPLVHVDVNYWKTELHTALSLDPNHSQAMTLFQAQASDHQMFLDHCCNERGIKVEAMGRTVIEWSLKKPGADNHYFDNLVGCMAAASMSGVSKLERRDEPKPKKSKLRVRQAQAW